jgi:hypothetical protein
MSEHSESGEGIRRTFDELEKEFTQDERRALEDIGSEEWALMAAGRYQLIGIRELVLAVDRVAGMLDKLAVLLECNLRRPRG